VLAASLVSNGYLLAEQYSTEVNTNIQNQTNSELQHQISDLQSQITNLTTETNNLQNYSTILLNQNNALQNQAATLKNQILSLQNENVNLKATIVDLQLNLPNRPNLVTRLGSTDVLNNSNANPARVFRPRLFIQGEVFNTGGVTAYNARLHVTLYIGNQIIEDTVIELGTIEPLHYASVNTDIHYEGNGSRLTNWTIIPEADTTP